MNLTYPVPTLTSSANELRLLLVGLNTLLIFDLYARASLSVSLLEANSASVIRGAWTIQDLAFVFVGLTCYLGVFLPVAWGALSLITVPVMAIPFVRGSLDEEHVWDWQFAWYAISTGNNSAYNELVRLRAIRDRELQLGRLGLGVLILVVVETLVYGSSYEMLAEFARRFGPIVEHLLITAGVLVIIWLVFVLFLAATSSSALVHVPNERLKKAIEEASADQSE